MLVWNRIQNGFRFLPLTQCAPWRRLRIVREPFFEVTIFPKDKLQSLVDNVVDTRRAKKFCVSVERGGERFLDPHVKLSLGNLGIRRSEQRHYDPPCEIGNVSSNSLRPKWRGKNSRASSAASPNMAGSDPRNPEGFWPAKHGQNGVAPGQ